MAARMASMRMMADLEALGDEPELEVDNTPAVAAGAITNGSTSIPNAMIASASPGDEDDERREHHAGHHHDGERLLHLRTDSG